MRYMTRTPAFCLALNRQCESPAILERQRRRYLDLYADELLTRREREEHLASGRAEQARLEAELQRRPPSGAAFGKDSAKLPGLCVRGEAEQRPAPAADCKD